MSAESARPAAAGDGCRIPVSTYRVQLTPRFRFSDLTRLLPYLARLGVTDVYTSPIFAAGPESEHGYDISDHNRLSDTLGGEAGFRELSLALRERSLGLIVDFVPNHMGVDAAAANLQWWDVLENGVCCPHARSFDIDWHPVKRELEGRVLLPILGDQYGRVLERGELRLAYEAGALVLHYFERRLPINPRRAPWVLRLGLERLAAEAGEADASLREFRSILTELENLPSIVESDPKRVAERHREKEVARDRLARLTARDTRILAHVQAAVRAVNGTPGEATTFDRLHDLLEGQAYRLAYWRTAFHEINYRRFFDVNGLASVRMEDPAVFDASHALLLRLVRAGSVTGIRIDHLDGLSDPRQYLDRLGRAVAAGLDPEERAIVEARAATGGGASAPRPPRYVVAEKILSDGESLPRSWSLHGTTGYDFLNVANGLFLDPRGEKPLGRAYERATGDREDFADVVYESKKDVMETTLASELNLLAHALNRISEGDRLSRDFTLNSLHDALREVVACLPVYRTYVTVEGPSAEDERILADAVGRARRRNPGMDGSIFDFVLDVTLGRSDARLTPEGRAERIEFVSKLQQYTGPVQAKGVEDTAFYRHGVLLARNEVGGSPYRFGGAPDAFFETLRERHRAWPYAMNATTTHDTKRGEDARARLDALSALPNEWSRAVSRWTRVHAHGRTHVDGAWAPDRRDQYFFYQTLLGVWPNGEPADLDPLVERLQAYMRKAIREAKRHTSWINENRPYERAVEDFVSQALRGRASRRFFESFLPFQRRVARAGAVHSLATVVLKATAPGVPDFYQGSEFWDLSLVDPDNRRPIDFAERERALEELAPLVGDDMPAAERGPAVSRLLAEWENGRIKMYVTARLLRERRAHPGAFLDGALEPLSIDGAEEGSALAFLRRGQDAAYVAVIPRLVAARAAESFPLGGAAWGDARVRFPDWWRGARATDVLTGATHAPAGREALPSLRLADVLEVCPVALLRLAP